MAAFSDERDIRRIIFQDMKSNMADKSYIFRKMIFADTAVIFGGEKSHLAALTKRPEKIY